VQRQALEHLGEHQGDATLDIAHGVGHELHPALIDCALHRLRNHIPLRTWQAALGAARAAAQPAPATTTEPTHPPPPMLYLLSPAKRLDYDTPRARPKCAAAPPSRCSPTMPPS
jgi:hypothetical protein